jgi:hypothetical protein
MCFLISLGLFQTVRAHNAGEWDQKQSSKSKNTLTFVTNAERAATLMTGSFDPLWSISNRPWDDPITPEGVIQATELAHRLESELTSIKGIVTCPSLRTFQTAVTIAKEVGISIINLDYSLCDAISHEFYGAWLDSPSRVLLSPAGLQGHADGLEVFQQSPFGPVPDEWEVDDHERLQLVAAGIGSRIESFLDWIVVVSPSVALKLTGNILRAGQSAEYSLPLTRNAAWLTLSVSLSPATNHVISLGAQRSFRVPFITTPGTNWAEGQFEYWKREFVTSNRLNFNGEINILEIGVWEGMSAVWWIENILSHHNDSRIVLVDPCPGLFIDPNVGRLERLGDDQFKRIKYNIRLSGQSRKATIVPKYSLDALSHDILPSGMQFDLIYIDGDHFARPTLLDALLSFQVCVCLLPLEDGVNAFL